jgi:hypothetical protein
MSKTEKLNTRFLQHLVLYILLAIVTYKQVYYQLIAQNIGVISW